MIFTFLKKFEDGVLPLDLFSKSERREIESFHRIEKIVNVFLIFFFVLYILLIFFVTFSVIMDNMDKIVYLLT